jgi:hypothetical protein
MNFFKKLPKEKRNQLILAIIGTVAVLSGLGLGLIRFQYDGLKNLAEKKAADKKKLGEMRDAVNNSAKYEAAVTEARKKLADMETDIATGDLYAWVINTLRAFKVAYKVEVPQFSPIGPVTEMTLLPDFPYKQATLTVAGTAHFHDFGKFLSDFENQYPHIRVQNLKVDAVPAMGTAQDPELVSFTMEIVTLVKQAQS